MLIKLENIKEYNGFKLQSSVNLDEKIVVLTGRNGSGKTRLLEGIQNNSISFYLNDSLLERQDIRLVAQSSLIQPQASAHYRDSNQQNQLIATLQYYHQIKNDFDTLTDTKTPSHHRRMMDGRGEEMGLDYQSILRLTTSIGRKLGKRASELTEDELILYYEEPSRNVLGAQNISAIVNQYIKRINTNKYNKYLKTQENEDVLFYSEGEFIKQFGDKPWILLNEILKNSFDGKFKFSIPDESSKSYSYQAELLQGLEETPVKVEHLSSGEKTLLWLALTLFNSQYYDSDMANAPKVLMLDEPDAFLHPKMVEKMYKVFKSFNKNFDSVILITTHSPTTVALAPSDNVYLVDDNYIKSIDKDTAVAELLDGVTQIAIDSKNRRQVYVESNFDADFYTIIFNELKLLGKVDPSISLNFIPSGAKVPEETLKNKLRQILDITDDVLVNSFVNAINGEGDCVKVVASVESLSSDGATNVRGIIDYDNKHNKRPENVKTLANNYAYAIENLSLDPINVIHLLHDTGKTEYSLESICGEKVSFNDWLENDALLQISVDWFIAKVLGRESKKDIDLKYISGLVLKTDSEYLLYEGHPLENKVVSVFPDLRKSFINNNQSTLKVTIAKKSMCKIKGSFIPQSFLDVILEVQK